MNMKADLDIRPVRIAPFTVEVLGLVEVGGTTVWAPTELLARYAKAIAEIGAIQEEFRDLLGLESRE